jgi:hypothetical protein
MGGLDALPVRGHVIPQRGGSGDFTDIYSVDGHIGFLCRMMARARAAGQAPRCEFFGAGAR